MLIILPGVAKVAILHCKISSLVEKSRNVEGSGPSEKSAVGGVKRVQLKSKLFEALFSIISIIWTFPKGGGD